MKLQAIVLTGTFVMLGLVTQSDEEREFQSWMRTTFTSTSSLRRNIEANAGEGAAKDAARLEGVFKQVREFWAKRNAADAVQWSSQAAKAASEAGIAAKEGDFEKAAAGLRALNSTCTDCHAAHREKLPEGGYRIK